MMDSASARDREHGVQSANVSIAGIESLDQRHIGERYLAGKYRWVDMLVRTLAELPKGCQGEQAKRAIANALANIGARFQREVPAGQGSAHAVDFLVDFDDDTIGVELGTGQAERIELDLLKLISLALLQKIDYACLILPRNLSRSRVFGKQDMLTAVRSLAQLCSPILTMVQAQLKDTLVIWYV